MRSRPNQASSRPRLFWRRFISALAIHALLMQPLLLAIAAPQLARAAAIDEVSLSELCVHNPDGSPAAPSDQQQYPVHQHCVQCFAGAFHFLDAPPPVIIASVNQTFSKFHHAGLRLRLSSSSQYSIACPRGPPTAA